MVDENSKIPEEMIPYVEFADNANERTPCVLVLDCSGSMRGEPIKQLNAGLKALENELKDDIDASSRVQLLIIKAYIVISFKNNLTCKALLFLFTLRG